MGINIPYLKNITVRILYRVFMKNINILKEHMHEEDANLHKLLESK